MISSTKINSQGATAVAILAQDAAVLSRRQPMGDQARSTALDVTNLVNIEVENKKFIDSFR
jgi:hypothetical protein